MCDVLLHMSDVLLHHERISVGNTSNVLLHHERMSVGIMSIVLLHILARIPFCLPQWRCLGDRPEIRRNLWSFAK